VESSAPFETKKEISKAKPSEKKDDGGTPGLPGTLSGNSWGRAALRREQREQLWSNHRENRATGRKMKPITDVTSIALGKEDMAVRL
jgi:hypothetical protein